MHKLCVTSQVCNHKLCVTSQVCNHKLCVTSQVCNHEMAPKDVSAQAQGDGSQAMGVVMMVVVMLPPAPCTCHLASPANPGARRPWQPGQRIRARSVCLQR